MPHLALPGPSEPRTLSTIDDVTPTRATVRTTFRGQLAAASDLYLYEQLVAFGWRMSVRTFRRLLLAGATVVLLAVTAGAVAVLRIARFHLIEGGGGVLSAADLAPVIALGLVAGSLYATLAIVAREALSHRRDILARSPNLMLFRGIDLDATAVFTAYCGYRIGAYFTVVLAVVLAGIGVFHDTLQTVMPYPVLLAVVPLAGCVTALAVAAYFATHVAHRSGWKVVLGASLLPAAYLAGRQLAMLWDLGAGAAAPQLAPGGWSGPPVTFAVAGGFGLLLVSAALLAFWIHRLSQRPFVHHLEPSNDTRVRTQRAAGPLRIGRVIHGEVVAGRPRALLGKIYTALALLYALGLGLSQGGAADGGTAVVRIAAIASFLVALTVSESVLADIGPGALRRHLRSAWELGLSVRRLTTETVGYYVLDGVVLGAACAAVTALVASTEAAIRVAPIPVAIFAAAALGEALATVPKEAVDGTTRLSLFAGLVTVVLSVPVLVAAMTDGRAFFAAAVAYVLLVIGGAAACVSQRVTVMQFESAT